MRTSRDNVRQSVSESCMSSTVVGESKLVIQSPILATYDVLATPHSHYVDAIGDITKVNIPAIEAVSNLNIKISRNQHAVRSITRTTSDPKVEATGKDKRRASLGRY